MSLNVYLNVKVMDDNQIVWEDDNRYAEECVFDSNITHNLTRLAREVDLYEPLWHPRAITASELIPELEQGLSKLIIHEKHCQQFAPESGWGTYENLLEFTRNYLEACKRWPDATVEVSR